MAQRPVKTGMLSRKKKKISPVAIYVWCSYGKAVRDFDLVFFAGTLLCMDGVGYGEGLRSLERVVAVEQVRLGQTRQSDGIDVSQLVQ